MSLESVGIVSGRGVSGTSGCSFTSERLGCEVGGALVFEEFLCEMIGKSPCCEVIGKFMLENPEYDGEGVASVWEAKTLLWGDIV